ncbi:MAG: response regulator [Candidatus Goldiibacteriota bacterium HGW-Goldbacteria-1]|jgi:CheY-like chemotaxis protein|nr:MAG: response regulator [Candidatus Goldiibacteriota bacterium HGW-Goldbacteria-1]
MENVTILIVDDNPVDVRLTIEALKQKNNHNEIIVLSDGEEALNFLNKKGQYKNAPVPDVILLDLKMPKVNGQEVLVQIKNDPKLSSIPVIVLSSSDAPADISESYLNKANCYITKPFDVDEFFRTIQAIENLWFDRAKLPTAPIKK